jgi:hypothetical protein
MVLYKEISIRGVRYIEVGGYLFTPAEVKRARKRGERWKNEVEKRDDHKKAQAEKLPE